MTREEIIRMAKEAWNSAGDGWVAESWFSDRADALVEFYRRAAEKERSARIAAKTELGQMKETLAKAGLAHRRAVQQAVSEAVAEEREACAKARNAKPRQLPSVGSGALLGEQQYCYEKGWKEGVAALRKAIRARGAA